MQELVGQKMGWGWVGKKRKKRKREGQRAFAAEILKNLEKGKHEPRAELGASPGGSSTCTRP